jgi:hypothetical protein
MVSAAVLAVGGPLLIDNEPLLVTEIAGTALTVERFATAYPFMLILPAQPTTAHAAGAPVYLLAYIDPWEMIAACALRPWTQTGVNGLGGNSATFGTYASGSLSVPVQAS